MIDLEVDKSNFPDASFRAYVKENFDTDGDGVLSVAERNAVDSVDVSRAMFSPVKQIKINSLKGIEHFGNLTKLILKTIQIISLAYEA